jgi:hypothetical protein
MCVVIDPPLFIPIFKTKDPKHKEFVHLINWVKKEGKGKLVFGGDEYLRQLRKISSILPYLQELRKIHKIINVDSRLVNAAEKFAIKQAKTANFDDAHLVGIVSVSGCRVVAVDDPRCHRFLKSSKLYLNNVKPPKLYTGAKNKNILSAQNLATCCT